jgi:membrane protease YdiL (CAAX protease family)
LAAFLVEYPFYLVPAFPQLRNRLAGSILPPFLVLSVLAPYILCYTAVGHLQMTNLLQLAAFPLALSVWYLVLPVNMAADLAFLAFLGLLLLSGYFDRIYVSFYPALPIAILGRLALFRTAAMVLLVDRGVPEAGYGFLPNGREWRVGLLHYLYFLPAAACLALPLRAVRFASPAPLWKTIGIFLAFLWVVALFEEFVFRGVLQPWLSNWTGSRAAGLLAASLVFGAVHLWFRTFPNWRWALLAGVLGWFCGRARNQADSIRAGMVTHALAVATWRGFFV